tara:strand:- start:182 stop:604 length:423 start_codon:yes stop_codon:yes gene_type:complete
MDRQGKITKDFDVHDYDTQISYTMKNLKKDVSKRNYETILDYDRNMKLSNLSKATRNKHLQAMLGITRKLPKDKEWKDVLRTDIDDLVIWIMETYADHKDQESPLVFFLICNTLSILLHFLFLIYEQISLQFEMTKNLSS